MTREELLVDQRIETIVISRDDKTGAISVTCLDQEGDHFIDFTTDRPWWALNWRTLLVAIAQQRP